jgi:hypothetical protein
VIGGRVFKLEISEKKKASSLTKTNPQIPPVPIPEIERKGRNVRTDGHWPANLVPRNSNSSRLSMGPKLNYLRLTNLPPGSEGINPHKI